MADFEDANSPTWHNMVSGQLNLRDAIDGTITYDGSDGRHYELGDEPRDAAGPPARLAPARAPPADRLRAGRGVAVRLRPVLLPLRPAAARAAASGRTSTCPRWSPISRRGSGTTSSASPRTPLGIDRGDDQGDGADRDAAGGVRDGGDPVRAARALRRAQRRALGLHLLGDQVLRRPSGDGPARPRRRDDDRPVHARLHRAAGRDVPPPRRPRDGRDGGADPLARRIPRPTSARSPACGPTRSARSRRATTAPGSPTPISSPVAREVFEPGLGGAPNQLERRRDDVHVTPPSSRTSRSTPGRDHRGRAAHQRQRRLPVPLVLAHRPRRGGDQLADGGRRDGRDLAHPDLAVGPPRRELEDGRAVTAELVRQMLDEETGQDPRAASARRCGSADAPPRRASSSTGSRCRRS